VRHNFKKGDVLAVEKKKKRTLKVTSKKRAIELEHSLKDFIARIGALEFSFPATQAALGAAVKADLGQHQKSLSQAGTPEELRSLASALLKAVEHVEDPDKKKQRKKVRFQANFSGDIAVLMKYLDRFLILSKAENLVVRSLLIALISEFDTFSGSLIRFLRSLKPHFFDFHNKEIPFREIAASGSLRSLEDFLVMQEIESLLRYGQKERLKWIQSKTSTQIIEKLPSFSVFMEATQRRNLFVHTDGMISSQYLEICKREGYISERPCRLGEKLEINQAYFFRASASVLEVGIMSAFYAVDSLNAIETNSLFTTMRSVACKLNHIHHSALAATLLEALVASKNINKVQTRLLEKIKIDLAIFYSTRGNDQKMIDILAAKNRARRSKIMEFYAAVLSKNYDKASKILPGLFATKKINFSVIEREPVFAAFCASEEYRTSLTKSAHSQKA
jgi:hypothetical protein